MMSLKPCMIFYHFALSKNYIIGVGTVRTILIVSVWTFDCYWLLKLKEFLCHIIRGKIAWKKPIKFNVDGKGRCDAFMLLLVRPYFQGCSSLMMVANDQVNLKLNPDKDLLVIGIIAVVVVVVVVVILVFVDVVVFAVIIVVVVVSFCCCSRH